jgi:hypothetical protein
MPEILPSFLLSARRSIASLGRLNRTVSLVTGLIVPTIVGIYATYYQDFAKINPILFWAPVVFFVVLGALFALYTWDIPLPAEALLEYLEMTTKQEGLERFVLSSTTLLALIAVWRTMTDEYIRAKVDNAHDIRDAIKIVMKTLVDSRDSLFNFRVNELWNFAVYLYDSEEDMLVPVWRDRHPEHPSPSGEGRKWKPGAGHIGLAFSQGEARITPDARIPGTAELLKLPSAQARPYDEYAYVSFISQPIPRAHPEGSWGVVVATSNVPDRFDEVTGLALNHAASELGTLLTFAYVGPRPI